MATALMGYYSPADGADAGTWGSSLNSQFTGYVDSNFAGITTLSLSSSNVLLTAAQARTQMLRLTGALLASVVISPDAGVLWNGIRCVENLTTGSFTVTLQNSAGSVVIPQNRRGLLYLDTTNGPRFVSLESTTNADTIPANNPMPFYVASAPSGWTQVTSLNDYALRIVSGTGAGTGGSVNFSTVFGTTSTGGYTLAVADIPLHGHPFRVSNSAAPGSYGSGAFPLTLSAQIDEPAYTGTLGNTPGQQIGGTGGGGSHAHPLDLRVKYADFILAQHV